jgi:hypothetical protein
MKVMGMELTVECSSSRGISRCTQGFSDDSSRSGYRSNRSVLGPTVRLFCTLCCSFITGPVVLSDRTGRIGYRGNRPGCKL